MLRSTVMIAILVAGGVAQQACVCPSDPTQYSALGNSLSCFGASDVTNLEAMFSGSQVTDTTRAFYVRCSDYDNNGNFQANDLTNMKRYYVGLMPLAAHHVATYVEFEPPPAQSPPPPPLLNPPPGGGWGSVGAPPFPSMGGPDGGPGVGGWPTWKPGDGIPPGMVAGRPFVVEGCDTPRIASASDVGGGWGSEDPPALLSPPADRDYAHSISAHWALVAANEHASVASFSRHALELLGLAAPMKLVKAAHEAALDEVHHAKLAYGLAAAYGDRTSALGPGILDVTDARAATPPVSADVAVAAVRDGCVGETIAAVQARAALHAADEPAVQKALRVIAEDEARHAALGWAVVQWIILQDASGVTRKRVERALALALSHNHSPPTPHSDQAPILASAGILSEAAKAKVAALAMDQVIRPAAAQLLAAADSWLPNDSVASMIGAVNVSGVDRLP